MRFFCDACGAAYSIDDERIAAKVVRIRCKRCAATIVLRGAGAPLPEADEPAEGPPAPADVWSPQPIAAPPPHEAPRAGCGDDSIEPIPGLPPRHDARRRLGRGPLGETYLATVSDCLGVRPVLCKRLGPLPRSAEARGRLKERLTRAAMFCHLRVAELYEACDLDNELWVTRRYVEGRNITPLALDPSGPAACRLLADRIRRCCAALEAAHQAGIFHLGVSPGNVFLCEDRDVRITGLGLTAIVGEMRRYRDSIEARGRHAAPELSEGLREDARCDVYSLGVLLERASEAPLRAIAARAAAVRPERRYPSTAALDEALEAYLAGRSTFLAD